MLALAGASAPAARAQTAVTADVPLYLGNTNSNDVWLTGTSGGDLWVQINAGGGNESAMLIGGGSQMTIPPNITPGFQPAIPLTKLCYVWNTYTNSWDYFPAGGGYSKPAAGGYQGGASGYDRGDATIIIPTGSTNGQMPPPPPPPPPVGGLPRPDPAPAPPAQPGPIYVGPGGVYVGPNNRGDITIYPPGTVPPANPPATPPPGTRPVTPTPPRTNPQPPAPSTLPDGTVRRPREGGGFTDTRPNGATYYYDQYGTLITIVPPVGGRPAPRAEVTPAPRNNQQ